MSRRDLDKDNPPLSPARSGMRASADVHAAQRAVLSDAEGSGIEGNLPAHVVQCVALVHNGKLVKEFWYSSDATLDLLYAPPESSLSASEASMYKYARLHTTNSYQEELIKFLGKVTWRVSKLVTAVGLIFTMTHDQHYQHLPLGFRKSFAWIVLISLFLWMATAARMAFTRIKTDAGDLVVPERCVGKVSRGISMMLLHMFDVPSVLRDAPAHLHTVNLVTPFACVLIGSSRVWILGYESQEQHYYENSVGMLPQLMILAAADLPLLFMKLYVVLKVGADAIPVTAFTLSLCFLVKTLGDAIRFMRCRRKYYDLLCKQICSNDEATRALAYLLLYRHFGKSSVMDHHFEQGQTQELGEIYE